MKITKQLSDDEFVVKLEEQDKQRHFGCKIDVVHDYVAFSSKGQLYSEGAFSLVENGRASGNTLSVFKCVQIPIKSMFKIVLPLLNSHPYLQEEHFKDRIYDVDDTYFKDHGQNKPRYLKGDKYPAYSYSNSIVRYWKENTPMIAFSMKGEKEYNHVTLKFFNEFVLPTLNK
jgi:hypothetical protein